MKKAVQKAAATEVTAEVATATAVTTKAASTKAITGKALTGKATGKAAAIADPSLRILKVTGNCAASGPTCRGGAKA
ncbi:hypothetical protein, partial [Accumulibacter sp.]|uniref:hypothetical protein n=1 Tax=Accumulibacter sp. TaxID=2053492 RepID=UPI002CA5CD18